MQILMKNGTKTIQVDEKRRSHYEKAGFRPISANEAGAHIHKPDVVAFSHNHALAKTKPEQK